MLYKMSFTPRQIESKQTFYPYHITTLAFFLPLSNLLRYLSRYIARKSTLTLSHTNHFNKIGSNY